MGTCTHVDYVLVEEAVDTLLVVANDVLVSLGLQPRTDTELCTPPCQAGECRSRSACTDLVLDGAQETRLLLGGLTTLVEDSEHLHVSRSLLVERRSVAEAAKTRLLSGLRGGGTRRAHLAWTAPVRARANMLTTAERVAGGDADGMCERAEACPNDGRHGAPYICKTCALWEISRADE